MASPFQGIEIASNALRAFQQQLDVTGHNISNVNTTGYSRQSATLVNNQPNLEYGRNPFFVGNGVTVSGITRQIDQLLVSRRASTESDVQYSSTLKDALGQVESLLSDNSGSGISSSLTGFFDAWSSLAANPNSSGQQIAVQQAGLTLSENIRNLYLSLGSISQSLKSQTTSTFDQIDSLSKQIDGLNQQIRADVATGATPNDLMDQRDQLIQKLSGLVDVRTSNFSDGSVGVFMNQYTLVDTTGYRQIPRTYDASTGTLTDGTTTYQVTSGSLAGVMKSLNLVSGYQTQLDNLANTLRTQVNTIYQTATNSSGVTGQNFFNPAPPATGAIDFDLAAGVKADATSIAYGSSGNAGDGGIAQSLSKLRDATQAGLGNATFTDYYSTFVSDVGRDSGYYSDQYTTKTAIATQMDQQIQSVSGVSLDDEMANMLKYQRCYQAAAKALSVFQQVTDTLVNLIQ